jgi:hypothetical protein
MFVLTPLFSAELNADLNVSGNLTDLAVRGAMQVLGGWVQLKGNQFEITSGAVKFNANSREPTLEIASEGSLRTPTGENVLVVLEAKGPISAPRINLASDTGLSHDELLLILTSSRSLTGRTLANRRGAGAFGDERFFLSPDSFSSFGSFIRNPASIDVPSFEPAYNPFSGQIEPSVVGRKNLAERLALVGSSTFGTVANSRTGVVYDLSRSLQLSAFAQSVSTQRDTALSADLTYTILSEQARLVDISFRGLGNTGETALLEAGRFGPASRIKNNRDSLFTIERDLSQYLVRQGYLSATVSAACAAGGEYCTKLEIAVNEGSRFTMSDYRVTGTGLPAVVEELIGPLVEAGEPARHDVLSEIERQVTIGLRNEGFIAARVAASFEPKSDSTTVTTVVDADPRQPISFVFEGNEEFSAEDFLNSIQLFERKRPFGNNTINLLVRNIERMYQERGYLYVNVQVTEDTSDPTRLTYFVRIREDLPARVRALEVKTPSDLPRSTLTRVMTELGYQDQIPLLEPEFTDSCYVAP